jgi:hypothetical protein
MFLKISIHLFLRLSVCLSVCLSFSLSRNNNNANEMEAHLNDETFLSLDQKGAKSHNDLLQITMVIGEYLCVLHKLNAGLKPFK